MSSPYIGEIRMFAGNFAPVGWALCNGQTFAIADNDALFQLIGTTYGGDGVNTFNLPDLQSRLPLHQGSNGTSTYTLGEATGVEQVTLTTNQLSSHSHAFSATTAVATTAVASGSVFAQPSVAFTYFSGTPGSPLNMNALTPMGGSQPHENRQPFLCVNFIIALEGVFPTQN